MLKVRDFAYFLEVDGVCRGRFRKVTKAMAGQLHSSVSRSRHDWRFGSLTLVAIFTSFVGVGVVEAQIGKQKGFDAVGGGSQAAVSFAGDTGVALRFYPHGSKPGFGASSSFQSMQRSALFRRLEGMEGSIWGQNIWASQNKKKNISRKELERLAEQQRKRASKGRAGQSGYMKGSGPFEASKKDRKVKLADISEDSEIVSKLNSSRRIQENSIRASDWFRRSRISDSSSKARGSKAQDSKASRSKSSTVQKPKKSKRTQEVRVRSGSQFSRVGHAQSGQTQATGKEWWAL